MSARDAVEARMRAKQVIDAAFEAAVAAGQETAAAIRDKDLSVSVMTDITSEVTLIGETLADEDDPE